MARQKADKKQNLKANLANLNRIEDEIAILSVSDFLEKYNINEDGLNERQVEDSYDLHGPNIIEQTKPKPWYIYLLRSFITPFNLVLLAVCAILLFTDVILALPGEKSYTSIIIILSIVLISSIFEFIQSYKANKAANSLKKLVSNTCTVKRDGQTSEIDISEVVIGDIIHLSAGDMIPADVRIVANKDLFVAQSSLTGESEPVEKFAELSKTEIKGLSDLDNICFMGTNVISGSSVAIVIAVGGETYFGQMASMLSAEKPKSNFEKGIDSISKLLLRITLIMVPIIFAIIAFTEHDIFGAFIFSISIAVGLTPELLPMILATTLGKGAIAMSKQKTIVKSMSTIQTFGAMDILCTDKTGTLTEDKIILEKYLDIHGNEDMRILRHSYLNSYFQTGLKSNIDFAIIERARKNKLDDILENYTKIDEIPFDFSRRRMSIVLLDKTGKRQLITKGAVEEMIGICSFAEYGNTVIPITEEIKREALEISEKLNNDGLRVVAVAQKNEVHDIDVFGVQDESKMVLIGFVGFLDPPKKSSKKAIKVLKENGIRTIVLTGDNELITKTVCDKVGIANKNIMLGNDMDSLSDEELLKVCEETSIFAKLSPAQKLRIVNVLQSNGHVVGFMGDGINDSPALRAADVGISVDTAVDIAKESADIILLEKDLMVLEEGMIQGRRTFGNLIKYIKMATSSNFGNVFSILIASIFLPFLPILPIQILVQNLLYDFSQITIPTDNVDKEYLEKPRKWDTDSIKKFMVYLGPLSSVFDCMMFAILYFVLKANTIEMQGLFNTGFFVFGLVSQTMIVHFIRTNKIPFIQSKASRPLFVSTVIIIAIACVLPYTEIGTAFGFVHLPAVFFAYLVGTILLYGIATQIMKKIFIKKQGQWI